MRTLSAVKLASAAVTLAGTTFLGGCGVVAPAGDEPICNDADEAVVSDIMATARTNFTIGDSDSVTASFDFIEAATAPIPERAQKYGAKELMVLLISVNNADPDSDDIFNGIQGPVYVVLDSDGNPLGPLGSFSQPHFDIDPPSDPGWTAWADGVDDSDVAYDLYGCVNPSR